MTHSKKNHFATNPAPQQKVSVDHAFQLASQHLSGGRPHEAELLLRKILQSQPKHAYALHLLGVVAHQAGKTEEATHLIRQAITSLPTSGQFHSNLGEMYRLLGKYDKAVFHGQKAVHFTPQVATSHSNLGIAYYDCKELEKAEACQRQALEIDPKLAAALNNLGSILRDRKDKEGAIKYYKQVLQVAPHHLESINNLGAVLTESERPEEAVKVLLHALKQNPHYAEAHCNIATAFITLEQLDKATAGFRKALELKANYPEAYIGLAKIYQEQKNLVEAEKMAHKAHKLAPKKAEVHSLLGSIFTEAGYPDKAELAFNKAITINPELLSAHLGKGHLRMEQGKLDKAEEAFLYAKNLDKSNLGAMLALAQVKKVVQGDDNMKALIKESEKVDTMLETKAIPLHFALGKCYDDTKAYDKAFPHYLEGCRLKRKRTHYNSANTDLGCQNIRNFFTHETITNLTGHGYNSDVPIFVLGMPRSGTTLTEQILASHPLVHGAGELPDLMQVANRPNASKQQGYPLSLENITTADLQTMGQQYVSGLRERNQQARHITDKMPANFNCLGLIHLMLPQAKIIHIKRNPVDTCLSGFTKLFNKTQHHSYNLEEIGNYYKNYAILMDHWRSVLPKGSFYELQYEELVADNETQTRALLEYCELEWDDACLQSHKTKRSIKTASITQVRQPIYTTSVERWKKYETHLGPLLETLGDLVSGKA